MVHLSLVPTSVEHRDRAARIDALQVDRSRFRGSVASDAMKKFQPLLPDEQACADRTAERTRRAKEHHIGLAVILRTFAAVTVDLRKER